MPPKLQSKAPKFNPPRLTMADEDDDDDDFQNPSGAISLTQNLILSSSQKPRIKTSSQPLKSTVFAQSSSKKKKKKKPKRSIGIGKENVRSISRVLDLEGISESGNDSISSVGLISGEGSKGCGSKVEKKVGDCVLEETHEAKGCQLEVSLIELSNKDRLFGVSDELGLDSLDSLEHGFSVGSDEIDIRTSTLLDSKRISEPKSSCIISSIDVVQESKECSSFGHCVVSGETRVAKGCQLEVNMIESSLNESSNKDGLFGVCDELGLDSLDSLEDGFSGGSDGMNGECEKDYILASIETPLLSETNENCNSSAAECGKKKGFEMEKGYYLSKSIESRLLGAKMGYDSNVYNDHLDETSVVTDFEPGTQLNVLMELCSELNSNGVDFREENEFDDDGLVMCPLCGADISDLSEESRLVHSNECLDRDENQKVVPPSADTRPGSSGQVDDASPVLEFLRNLGLSKYEEVFVKEEIDWETLHWLTEEDLFSIGITALGPRKKIALALNELRKVNTNADGAQTSASKARSDESKIQPSNKLITEYFPGSFVVDRNKNCPLPKAQPVVERTNKGSRRTRVTSSNRARNAKVRDTPSWCCVPGTPFRVDAFRYLRGDCAHWFLTHFHVDHYQGLTKSFCHGKIYCSSITAHLVNMKLGVSWDRLQVLPLNETISISGVDVTCLDANHCPGSVIILFKPPNGKVVLHTGDFRYSEQMAKNIPILQSCPVHTLILDTTYCNPQYDFPKQEAVIQFVIEAIQAEAFNPKTLFLIGSYTIGKERLFLEVARCLRKKVYVGAAKLRLLECLGLPEADMQWFTLNEQESHIHVVPMWTIASFKRMKHLSNLYSNRFNLIVAFSPTGWTFGKGKKKTPGRRMKQGTIIRYEVPYSEHSSFTELREFVKFISPRNIIPSVNNDGLESADSMVALLTS